MAARQNIASAFTLKSMPTVTMQVVQKYVQQIQASTRPSAKQQRLEEPSRKVGV